MKKHIAVLTSPIGKLGIVTFKNALQRIEFLASNTKTIRAADAFSKEVVRQLQAYFKNPKFTFDIPLELSATPFQERVLSALQKIPLGETNTYGELAAQLKTGARAIGNACRRNPVPIVIPCHRVVAKNGLGGFSGKTSGRKIDIKTRLLNLEKI